MQGYVTTFALKLKIFPFGLLRTVVVIQTHGLARTRVRTWVIGQPGIRGVKASCSFEKLRYQIHSFISYEGSKFRSLESLASIT